MGFGFTFSESFSGSYYRLDEPFTDRAIRIRLDLGVDGLRRFLRDRRVEAEGRIVAEGLAEEGRPLFGSVHWKLHDERRIPYDLEFEGDDGGHYRLRGQRDFFVHDAKGSLTTLPASLYDTTGAEVARATLRFDLRTELGPLVRSFRPRVRLPALSTPRRTT
jgi:hypothetical protein